MKMILTFENGNLKQRFEDFNYADKESFLKLLKFLSAYDKGMYFCSGIEKSDGDFHILIKGHKKSLGNTYNIKIYYEYKEEHVGSVVEFSEFPDFLNWITRMYNQIFIREIKISESFTF